MVFSQMPTISIAISFAIMPLIWCLTPAHRTCPTGEYYTQCGRDCRWCEDIGRPVSSECAKSVCRAGCFCRKGLYRDEAGGQKRCVRPDRCSARVNRKARKYRSRQECAEGEVFMKCGKRCGRRCRDVDRRPYCPEHCVSGCFCRYGRFRNEHNECVKRKQCPKRAKPKKKSI